ncbi:MAG: hypothetical protein QM755_24680 [Luteolibacter sp.]
MGWHVLAGVCGWGVVTLAASRGWVAVRDQPARQTARSLRPAAQSGGEEILGRLIAKDRKIWEHDSGGRIKSYLQYRDRVAALRTTLKPAADRAAAALEAVAVVPKEMGLEYRLDHAEELAIADVRLLQWLEADPGAAMAWFKSGGSSEAALTTWASEASREDVISQLELGKEPEEPKGDDPFGGGSFKPWQRGLVMGMASGAAGKGDWAAVLEMRDKLPASMRAQILATGVSGWPEERLGELVTWAKSNNQGAILRDIFHRLPAEQVCTELESILAMDNPEELRKGLVSNLTEDQIIQSDLPFERREALLKELRKGSGEGPEMEALWVRQTMANSEQRKVREEGLQEPIRSAFEEGAVGAEETLQSLMALTPDAPRLEPEALKTQFTWELIEQNPEQGLALLNPQERAQKVTDWVSSRETFAIDPRKLARIFQTLSSDATPVDPKVRAQAWRSSMSSGYGRYGDELVGWVQTLPAGADRDMAISSLAGEVNSLDPVQAKALRGMASKAGK